MKHEPMVTANAAAATTVIVYAVCRILVGLFPDLSFTIAQSWFHGIELSKLSSWDLTISSFILGVVSMAVTAWLIGYLFAFTYNWFLKKK